jgi:hypothetical protein
VTSRLIFLGKYNKQDETESYARRFRIKCDLSGLHIAPPNEFLRFRIFARDSVSSLGKFFYKDYSRDLIQIGTFKTGDSFEII